MMRSRLFWLPILALCSADFQRADLAIARNELEGTWCMLSHGSHWVFSGNKVEMIRSGRKVNEGIIHVDYSCSPPAIDMTIPSTSTKYLGIFRISGNELLLRDLDAVRGARPTSFDPLSPGTTYRFKRVR